LTHAFFAEGNGDKMITEIPGTSKRWHRIQMALFSACLCSLVSGKSCLGQSFQPPETRTPWQTEQAVVGKVKQLLINPPGDVDGLLLTNGVEIHLPPESGRELANVVQAGSAIAARGTFHGSAVFAARVIMNSTTGNCVQVKDSFWPMMPRQAPPANLKPLQASGKIVNLLHGPAGEANGFVLSDGTIVRFHQPGKFPAPESNLLGLVVTVSGAGTQNPQGRCLEASAIRFENDGERQTTPR
jgi:hypothetical protein